MSRTAKIDDSAPSATPSSAAASHDAAEPPGARARREDGFPRGLLRLLDPARGAAPLTASLERETGPGLCLTPLGAGGATRVLARRVTANEAGPRIEARLFTAEAFAAQGPAMASRPATLLSGLEGDVSAAIDEADRQGAARLLAALEGETESLAFAPSHFVDAAIFWRAVAALLTALPPALRPMLSACSGFTAPIPGALLQYRAGGGAETAPEDPPSAEDLSALERLSAMSSEAQDEESREAETANAAEIARLLAGRDAADLGHALRLWIRASAQDAPADRLTRFLSEAAAPPPAPPDSPRTRRAHLAQLLNTLDSGLAHRGRAPAFGLARAVGLIAATADDTYEPAWTQTLEARPDLAPWSALTLGDPDWLPEQPIGSLPALSRLLAADARARSALPAGAPTPLDAPACRERVRRMAEDADALLTSAPESLAEAERVSAWARLRPELFAEAPDAERAAAAQALETIQAAAERSGRAALAEACRQVRERSDLDIVAHDAATLLADAAGRWAWTELAGDWAAAAFWEEAAALLAADCGGAAALWRALFAAWRAGWSDAGAPEPEGLLEPLLAASGPDAVAAAIEDGLGVRLAETLTARARPGAEIGPGAAMSFAAEALALTATLCNAATDAERGRLRDAAAPLLKALDAVAASDPELEAGGRGGAAHARAAEALADLLLSWSASVTPETFPPSRGASAGAPRDGLARLLAARFGAPLTRYLSRLDAGADAPAGPAPDFEWRAFLKRRGRAYTRTMAQNAVAAWRAHFLAALAARAGGGAAEEIALAPAPDPAADGEAIKALAELAEADEPDLPERLGEDVAWTLRQMTAMEIDPKFEALRDRLAHRPAPAAIRAGWEALRHLSRRADAGAPELFFLFLATKILQRGDPLAAPFLDFLREKPHQLRFEGGKMSERTKGKLRQYLYLERPEETALEIAALEDDAFAARAERTLFFLCLVCNRAVMPAESLLWAPLAASPAEVARLEPPQIMRDRLIAFLTRDEPLARAFLSVLDRHLMFMTDGWRDIETSMKALARPAAQDAAQDASEDGAG